VRQREGSALSLDRIARFGARIHENCCTVCIGYSNAL
jgi:aconitase A